MSFLIKYGSNINIPNRIIDLDIEPNLIQTVVDKELPISLKSLGFIKGSLALIEKFGIYPGKGLVEFNNDMRIIVSNLSNKSVSLPGGCLIGKIEIIDLGDIEFISLLEENKKKI